MTANPKRSEQLNIRISPDIRKRIDTLAGQYDQTVSSIAKIALVIGLRELERIGKDASGLFPNTP